MGEQIPGEAEEDEAGEEKLAHHDGSSGGQRALLRCCAQVHKSSRSPESLLLSPSL